MKRIVSGEMLRDYRWSLPGGICLEYLGTASHLLDGHHSSYSRSSNMLLRLGKRQGLQKSVALFLLQTRTAGSHCYQAMSASLGLGAFGMSVFIFNIRAIFPPRISSMSLGAIKSQYLVRWVRDCL